MTAECLNTPTRNLSKRYNEEKISTDRRDLEVSPAANNNLWLSKLYK